jgi:hypothetical protein
MWNTLTPRLEYVRNSFWKHWILAKDKCHISLQVFRPQKPELRDLQRSKNIRRICRWWRQTTHIVLFSSTNYTTVGCHGKYFLSAVHFRTIFWDVKETFSLLSLLQISICFLYKPQNNRCDFCQKHKSVADTAEDDKRKSDDHKDKRCTIHVKPEEITTTTTQCTKGKTWLNRCCLFWTETCIRTASCTCREKQRSARAEILKFYPLGLRTTWRDPTQAWSLRSYMLLVCERGLTWF